MMKGGLMTRSSSCEIVIDRFRVRVGGSCYVGRRLNSKIRLTKCSKTLDLTSLKCQTVLSVMPIVSATSESHSQTSETAVDQEGQVSTVRVKFQLQKSCVFGDHFLVVGDDPLFGSWDPVNGIKMEWSDGHMWTAEVDVPVEKTIQFKFILKQSTGDIIWQPGPDRVFKAWTTTKTVTVAEDWENSDMQNIVEDGVPGYDAAENIIFSNDSSLKSLKTVASAVGEGGYTGKESSISMMVAHNIVSEPRRFISNEGVEDEEAILSDPVLVPGLASPMSTLSADESPFPNEDKNTDLNGSVSSQDSNDQTALEEETQLKSFTRQEKLKGEREEEQRNKMKLCVEVESTIKDTTIHDLLKKDMHWILITLQNLLSSLRFFLASVIRSVYD